MKVSYSQSSFKSIRIDYEKFEQINNQDQG